MRQIGIGRAGSAFAVRGPGSCQFRTLVFHGGPVHATETPAPVSPHEIMVKQGGNLPAEYWAHPF
jgi:hypothetical protein